MKPILIFVALGFVLIQSILPSKLLAHSRKLLFTKLDTLSRYNEAINDAERSIIKGDYKWATYSYTSAFNNYGGVRNQKDLINAFYAAMFIEDTSLSIHYLDSLAFYGADKGRFMKNFTRNRVFENRLIRRYDSIQSIGKQFLDHAMIKSCDSFLLADRHIRIQLSSDKSEAGFKEFKRLDSLNYYAFLDYIRTHGPPTMQKIGFSKLKSDYPNQTNVFYLLVFRQSVPVLAAGNTRKYLDLISPGYLLPFANEGCKCAKYSYCCFILSRPAWHRYLNLK